MRNVPRKDDFLRCADERFLPDYAPDLPELLPDSLPADWRRLSLIADVKEESF